MNALYKKFSRAKIDCLINIFFIFALSFLSGTVFATEYHWVGNATGGVYSGEWNNLSNWNTATNNSGTSPADLNELQAVGTTLTIDADKTPFATTDTTEIIVNGTVKTGANMELTFANKVTAAAFSAGDGATLTFNGDAKIGSLSAPNNSNLTFYGNTKVTNFTGSASSIKINQGTGAQTTSFGTRSFTAKEFDFGNDKNDSFDLTGTTDSFALTDVEKATFAGTIKCPLDIRGTSGTTINAVIAADTTCDKNVVFQTQVEFSSASAGNKFTQDVSSTFSCNEPMAVQNNAYLVLGEFSIQHPVTVENSGTLTLAGKSTVANTVTVANGGTLQIDGSNSLTVASGGTITSDGTITASGTGTVTVESGGKIESTANGTMNVSRPLTVNDGGTLNSSNILNVKSGGAVTISASATFDATKTVTVEDGGTLTVNQKLAVKEGTTFTSGGTIKVTGSGVSQIKGELIIESTGGFSASKSVSVEGNVNSNGAFSAEKITVTGNGKFTLSDKEFSCSKEFIVQEGGAFTQTGDNGTNTQTVGSLENEGTMIWDSDGNGGSLVITNDDAKIPNDPTHLIHFGSKILSFSSTNPPAPFSGIFIDFTIPDGKTFTNGNVIVVRRNFTIEGSGVYAIDTPSDDTAETPKLHLGKYENPSDSSITGIISRSSSDDAIKLPGKVVIVRQQTTKTFQNPMEIENLECIEDNLSGDTGTIDFQKNLTVDTAELWTRKIQFSSTGEYTTTFEKASRIDVDEIHLKGTLVNKEEITFGGHDDPKEILITSDNSNLTFSQTAAIVVNKKVTIDSGTGNIELNQPIKGDGSLSIENGGVLRIKNEITIKDDFAQTGDGDSQIASKIESTAGSISFNSNVYIDRAVTLKTLAENNTIAVGEDLYISALDDSNNAETVTFESGEVNVKGNIVLFNGNVALKANLTSGKDTVFLNGNATEMFKDTATNVNLFAYNDTHSAVRTQGNNATRFAQPALATFPTSMPDGTTAIAHTTYKSTIIISQGRTIKSGGNFYSNGVDLNAGGEWILSLADNDNASKSFAEFYNAKIDYCRVKANDSNGYAWLSAGETTASGSVPFGYNNLIVDRNSRVAYDGKKETLDTYCTRQKTGIAFLHPIILKDDGTQSASEGRTVCPEIPNLSGTYSLRDNVIRVEFVRSGDYGTTQPYRTALIENSNNEISAAIQHIKYNNGANTFSGAYIDAECTTPTNGKGDIAVFYLKAADGETWNLDATGIDPGTKGDMNETVQNKVIDIQIERALANVFATLTDDHKNRIGSYVGDPTDVPNDKEGFRFTATTTRSVIGEMHIAFSLADFNSNKIYLYFDKPLSDNITWATYTVVDELLKTENSIKFYKTVTDTSPDSDLYVESVDKNSLSKNGLILTLNRNLSYDCLEYGIKIEYGASFLFNNKIHSPDRYIVNSGEAHCISDFLVDGVDILYAYDNRLGDSFAGGDDDFLNINTSIAIRDFSENVKNSFVSVEKDITMVTKDVSGYTDDDGESKLTYKLIADISPSPKSQGEVFTEYSGVSTRVFVPATAGTAVSGFSTVLNDSPNLKTADDADGSEIVREVKDKGFTKFTFHNDPEETPCLDWGNQSKVHCLFEVYKDGNPIIINHKFDSAAPEETPLYAVRLKNPSDFTSIDVWSFTIMESVPQRGGVSIFSNVVNALNRDICTLEVNMPSDGQLRVIVMTLDGNVIKYLENSRQTQGLHYYYWDGTNNAGNPVSRGMYFVRVVGPGIDETRKVMVIK